MGLRATERPRSSWIDCGGADAGRARGGPRSLPLRGRSSAIAARRPRPLACRAAGRKPRADVARLEAAGLAVIAIPEAEVRAGEVRPSWPRRRLKEGRSRRVSRRGNAARERRDLRFIRARDRSPGSTQAVVRGSRKVRTATRRTRGTASISTASRFPAPLELDPGDLRFRRGPSSAARRSSTLREWLRAIGPRRPDRRHLPKRPAGPRSGEADRRVRRARPRGARPGGGSREKEDGFTVLDNLAQFRFYSAWRAAVRAPTRQLTAPKAPVLPFRRASARRVKSDQDSMKLIVQIPCLNEEADAPRDAPGASPAPSRGSTRGGPRSSTTAPPTARARWLAPTAPTTSCDSPARRGSPTASWPGSTRALRLGADVIVNTDADNQYPGHEIPRLIAPILAGEADMVVGDRTVTDVAHFSWTKKRLQTLGSWVVRKVSGTAVPDTTSGFRALTREAALRINIVSEFTYTLESIIQAGKKKMAVAHLPIEARETRPSRLFGSTWEYVKRSGATILRIYAMYEPFKVFILLGSALFCAGVDPRPPLRLVLVARPDHRPHPVGDPFGPPAHPRLPDPPVGHHGRPHREQPQAHRRPALPRPQGGAPWTRASWLSPRHVSVVIPAFNEEEGIAAVVGKRRGRETRGARSSWWTTAPPTAPPSAPRPRGRGSSAIPTTRATAPRSRPASAKRTGERDPAHGRRRPARSRRTRPPSSTPVGVHDMVIGARVRSATRPGPGPSATRVFNAPGLLADRPPHPGPDLRLSRRPARPPPRDPPPAAQRLLLPHDLVSRVLEGGPQRRLRARSRRIAAGRHEQDPGCSATACGSC